MNRPRKPAEGRRAEPEIVPSTYLANHARAIIRAWQLSQTITECFCAEFPRLSRIPIINRWALRQYTIGWMRKRGDDL